MIVKQMMPSSGNSMAPKSTESTKNYRQSNVIKSNSFCPLSTFWEVWL